MAHDLQPLLLLLIFVPTFLAGAVCAALVSTAVRFTRLDPAGAKAIVALCWWMTLSAALWIGCDHLMATGRADNGAPFAALFVWTIVVLPGPLLGNWIMSLSEAKRSR